MHHEKNRVVTCITHLILNGNIDLYGGAEFPHPLAPHRPIQLLQNHGLFSVEEIS